MFKELYDNFLLQKNNVHSIENLKEFLLLIYNGQIATITEKDICSFFLLINNQIISENIIDDLERRLIYKESSFAKDLNLPRIETSSGHSLYVVEDGYIYTLSNRLMAWNYSVDGIPILDSIGRTQEETRINTTIFLSNAEKTSDWDFEICNLVRIWGYNLYEFFFYSFVYVLAMEKDGYLGKYLIPRSPFSQELMEMAGVSSDRIISISNEDGKQLYHVKRNIIPVYPSDYLMELAMNWGDNLFEKDSYDSVYPERLFIERADGRILNGVDQLINEYGFTKFRPETVSIPESIKYFQKAKIIIAPFGAANTRFLFCKEGTCIIETFPSSWISAVYVNIVRLRKLKYQMVVEERLSGWKDNSDNGQYANYYLDEKTFRCAIENAIELSK